MKNSILFFILFSVWAFSCSKSNEKQITNDSSNFSLDTASIYSFVNEVLLEENSIYTFCDTILDRKPYIIENENFNYLDSIKNELSKSDLESIKSQCEFAKTFVFEQEKIKNKILISPELQSVNNIACIGSVGIPLFNNDKSLAIIEVSHHCGFLCGKSAIIVYRKDDKGEWKEHEYLLMVVS